MISHLLRLARRFPIANLGPLWLVSSEPAIRQILSSPDYGKGGPWATLAPLLGEGLILSEGDAHKCQRKQLGGALAERGCAAMESVARQVVSWKANALSMRPEPFNLAPEMLELSERVVLRCLFGQDAPAQLGRHIQAAMRVSYRRMLCAFGASLVPGLRRVKPSAWERIGRREFDPAMTEIRRMVAQLPRPAWLPEELPPGQRVDQLVTMYVAATETTAAALTWMLALLGGVSRNNDKFGNLADFDPGKAIDIPLIAAPPIWFLPRTAVRDTLLCYSEGPNTRIGREVRAGDTMILLILGTGAADLAFGYGRRQCIGERFAKMVMRLVLEEFGVRFRLELQNESSLEKVAGLTLWPRRAIVKVEGR